MNSFAPAKSLEVADEPSVKLLLVDDHAENLLALEAILEAPGRQLVLAHSGAEALRHLLHGDFAAIILDVMMPEMDGFETAALIRQRERSKNTPIIFLTALGRSEEALFRGYDIGAVDYLVKPVVPAILKSKIAVFVQLKRQSELLEAKNIELNAMIEELEAFSYSVAHDLRAPLARIDGFSEALLERQNDRLDEEGKLHLQRVRATTHRMCRLVDDLLRLSRLSRAEMNKERVDMSALARSAAAELQQREPDRHVDLIVQPDVIRSYCSRPCSICLKTPGSSRLNIRARGLNSVNSQRTARRCISSATMAQVSIWPPARGSFRRFSVCMLTPSFPATASDWPRWGVL